MEPSGLLSHPARLAGLRLLRMQSDERLVELARAGHEPAFDAIVDRYRPPLLRYCTRILGPERAEDAVQQALASAHTAMTSGDERHLHLRPWLYRIAHNTALNVLRGVRRDEVELTDTEFAAAHTPEDQVAERERLESVLAAIAALPRSQRDALLLRELEGRSHEEIGRALGVSSGAARATLFRARAAVRTACSALTPTPLLLRLVEVGDSSSHVAAKAVAGVLAGCAIVGGGGAATGVIGGGTHHPVAPAEASASAPEPRREGKRPRVTPASPVTTAAAPVVVADGATKARKPAAALRAVEKPKPMKRPQPGRKARREPKPKPPAVAPATAPAASEAAEKHEDRGEHRGGHRREREARRPETDRRPERGPRREHQVTHGRDASRGRAERPDRRGQDRGRGHHRDHDEVAAAVAPAASPSEDTGHRPDRGRHGRDRTDKGGQARGRGHDKAPEADTSADAPAGGQTPDGGDAAAADEPVPADD